MKINVKHNKWTVFFCILSVFAIGFIFYNSMQNPVESEERSLAIVEHVQPILDAEGRMTQTAVNHVIRACAHWAEFAILGFRLGGLFVSLQGQAKEKLIRNVLLVATGVAIADEILQYFTGRYTDIKDVMLDVLGALIGVLIIKVGVKMSNKKAW